MHRSKSETEVIGPTRVMGYVAAVTASERIVLRLRDEMDAQEVSQTDLAAMLHRRTGKVWEQARVSKVLTLYVSLKVEDLDAICQCLRLSLTEAVRDPGLEFYAEMTPSELRLFQRLRRQPEIIDAIFTMLRLPKPPPPEKGPEPEPKKKRGRPLASLMRSEEKPAQGVSHIEQTPQKRKS